jgi:23S rRNA (guanine745-N1)-methyltransferase
VDDPSGLGRPFVVLDAGCGEGTLVSRVFGGWPMAATTDLAGAASPGRIGIAGSLSPGTPVERPTTGQRAGCASPAPAAAPARTVSLFGIDLSVAAIRLAAKSFPWATWIVANADRSIPLADRSCDLVLSLFGRRNPDEFRRALKPGGHALVVVPGEDDLQELRAAIHGHAPAQERAKAVVAEFVTPTGASARMPGTEERFSLAWSAEWRSPALLDRGSMLDLLAITYRGSRHSESKRLEARGLPEPPRVTLSAQALLFRATS